MHHANLFTTAFYCSFLSKDTNIVTDAIFLILRYAFGDPGDVAYFLGSC